MQQGPADRKQSNDTNLRLTSDLRLPLFSAGLVIVSFLARVDLHRQFVSRRR